ncbi:unnamed protein product [Didymodactylos carnosus]|uniref:PiggyBac transposable element-derived protein 4 C-terminal zinc-ribbon domain-containing protein n=1 Tax=Didymodactylos carnosus TaxID=1234261 RepID=A0A815H837_9BILA|nr:unnamed protein product [Didymodactylos carnosus]CAF1350577.1 unnamed protein product [Didymodactylos carnosus]CAF4130965.1 unnamed protein product [Didymodactylos carnosus]CAF4220482.1 unnamed protein product [Didymodactylos carnosus]
MERMFRFKSEIARVLLQRPTLFTKSVLQSIQVDYSSAESDDENENYSPPKKRSKRESKLSVSDTLRYDAHDHWPTFQPAKSGLRCKNEGCKQRTKWICSKCNIHLCVHPAHNRFKSYHIQS